MRFHSHCGSGNGSGRGSGSGRESRSRSSRGRGGANGSGSGSGGGGGEGAGAGGEEDGERGRSGAEDRWDNVDAARDEVVPSGYTYGGSSGAKDSVSGDFVSVYDVVEQSIPAGVGLAFVSADTDVLRPFSPEAGVHDRLLTWSWAELRGNVRLILTSRWGGCDISGDGDDILSVLRVMIDLFSRGY